MKLLLTQCDRCKEVGESFFPMEIIVPYKGNNDHVNRDLCPKCHKELLTFLGRAGIPRVLLKD